MALRGWWWRTATRPIRAASRLRRRRPTATEHSRLSLIARQDGTDLHLRMETGTGLDISAVTYRDEHREHPALAPVSPHTDDGVSRSEVVIDLADLARRVPAINDASRPGTPAGHANGQADNFTDVRLALVITSDQLRPPKYAVLDSAATPRKGRIRYFAPLGRFRHTELHGIAPVPLPDGRTATVRTSVNGHLVVRIGDEPPGVDAEVSASGATVTDGILTVRGTVGCGSAPLTTARLVLAGRGIPARAASEDAGLEFDPEVTAQRRGRWQYRFAGSLDLRDLVDPDASLPPHSIADLFLEVTSGYGGTPALRRLGGLPFEGRKALEESTVLVGDSALEAIPYFTFKSRNISFRLEQYEADAYRMLIGLARIARRSHRPARRHRGAKAPIWIVGERPHTAQDNGFHLFRHLRSERPDIDAYYVITADSPDRTNLAGLDHVVTFGSVEHMRLVLAADRMIGTHHADYLLPSQSKRMIEAVTAPRVFLQHGVMGSKWMVPNYGKFGTDFHADLICVSSERERELIVTDFGYRRSEVAVTGLARFDALFAEDVPMRSRQVLIAPTWRDWLGTDERFLASDYLAQWRALMADPRLAALQRAGATVKLYLHSNMQRYLEYFADSGVDVVIPGSVDLQHLLKESAVLITDYSSSSFDFSFLHRPVIYFQFDRDRFFGALGSHLDLDEELPGFVAPTREAALTRLAEVLRPGFTLERIYRERADRFLAHRDRHHCERIVAAVEGLAPLRTLSDRVQGSEQLRVAGTRFRASQRYFGVMKLLFRAAKLLPAKDVIVFESDTGKGYTDSPRAIYEELLRRGDPRPRVWIYHRTPPVVDPRRTVVKRFSPRYFLTLARAKYWVTNQNLPHYITRRRRGVYLQTWHGTPLKKMQHDLAQVVGRDDGYLDRVTRAAAQWTALLSPSPYATSAFRSAFRYTGEVLELGYPRNDILAKPDAALRRRQVRARLGIDDATRVLLYAPTFRDDQKRGRSFIFDLPLDLERFAREFGGTREAGAEAPSHAEAPETPVVSEPLPAPDTSPSPSAGASLPENGPGTSPQPPHPPEPPRPPQPPRTLLLLRMHRLVANSVVIPDSAEDCVRDLSSYGEIADLYLAADALIADYSSVIFDFAITGKPILFYPYDLGRYRDDVRGFYLDYETEMPGPIARTEDELYAALRSLDDPAAAQRMCERAKEFARRFAPRDDGHAAERVVDAVFGPRGDRPLG